MSSTCLTRILCKFLNSSNKFSQISARSFSSKLSNHQRMDSTKKVEFVQQTKPLFDYYLVLDFEATCDTQQIHPQEIIEFPVLKINAVTLEEESHFHQYVKPQVHPQLTKFCSQLTGIVQDMIEDQPDLTTTLEMFNSWMTNENLLKPDVKFTFVTCGDWDLNFMLPKQCKHFEIPMSPIFNNWVNIKQIFAAHSGHFPKGLATMLYELGLKHSGRAHSGIDDCRSIAGILRELIQRGVLINVTKRR